MLMTEKRPHFPNVCLSPIISFQKLSLDEFFSVLLQFVASVRFILGAVETMVEESES